MMKGNVDVIYLIAMLFVVVIAVAAGIFISNNLFSGLEGTPQINSCANCINALNKGAQAQAFIPNAIVLVFILMCFASVIVSAFLNSSPVFFIFEVITIPIELFISFVLHDAFFSIASQSFIGTALASTPSIALLFEYLPVLVLVISIVVGIITFVR